MSFGGFAVQGGEGNCGKDREIVGDGWVVILYGEKRRLHVLQTSGYFPGGTIMKHCNRQDGEGDKFATARGKWL